jgi:hypothetical protein
MSGIIFAGCSFTHGHGLWYYCNKIYDEYRGDSDLSNVIENRNSHHLRYKDVIRFPRLVSQEFECFEITRNNYSGNDEDSVDFINSVFNFKLKNHQWTKEQYSYDEVKFIIFQTSRPERCHYITPNGKIRVTNDEDEVFKMLKNNGFVDYNDFEEKLTNQLFQKIRKTFIHYERKGITPLIFNWSNHYNKLIEKDPYMNERKIHIKHKDREFKSLDDTCEFDNNLLISGDYEFFGNNPPVDNHPSKKFHRIIADSIIDKIKFIEKNNLQDPPLNYI